MISCWQVYMSLDAKTAVEALSALAHESRLGVFRLLIQQGPEGLPAGVIAEHLDIQRPVASFHLRQLSHARLVQSRRIGRSILYVPNYETMDCLMAYLNENCCIGIEKPANQSAMTSATGRASVRQKKAAKAR